jgi:hypothetical protein
MPSGLSPKFNPTSELKSKLMRPALTSHYAAYFNVAGILAKEGAQSFFNNRQANIDGEFLSLSCSEASLPGSSLATHEINNDFTGVTERHVYRRQYDDRIDFTFYVDHDYTVIKFFETWMSWIVGEDQFKNQAQPNFTYRVKFPEDYKVNIHVQKFEKDLVNYAEYTFVGAYPISITSMPVSYDSSQLLKCTVSFTYMRYYMENLRYNTNSLVEIQQNREDELRRNLPPGTTFAEGGIDLDALIRNNPAVQSQVERLTVIPYPGQGEPYIR